MLGVEELVELCESWEKLKVAARVFATFRYEGTATSLLCIPAGCFRVSNIGSKVELRTLILFGVSSGMFIASFCQLGDLRISPPMACADGDHERVFSTSRDSPLFRSFLMNTDGLKGIEPTGVYIPACKKTKNRARNNTKLFPA